MSLEITIEKLLHGGAGIGRLGKIVVFVPFSAPGDRLRVDITERRRNYWQGQIAEIVEASPLRASPRCPHYGICGGCNLQHLSYDSQLMLKRLVVRDCLQRLGKLSVEPAPCLSGGVQWRYRNKTQFPIADQPWRVGFYRGRSHEVVDVPRCLIHPESFDRLRAAIVDCLNASGETAYDERDGSGNLRHLVIRQGAATGELALIFVTATASISPRLYETFASRIADSNLVSIVHNINPARTNRVLGTDYRLLAGEPYYTERLLGYALNISAASFFQANTPATELLVKQLLDYLEPDGQKTILDLFCGIGTFTLPAAARVGRVIGIEADPYAVEDARRNAQMAGLRNVEIIQSTVEHGITRVTRADAAILDPPRKGCSHSLLKNLVTLKPQLIVYISCNPSTLARDLAVLGPMGYQAVAVQPIDMFPQTAHVETIVKLVLASGAARVNK